MAKINFKNSSILIKRITQSASFALLLSVAFFAYEMSSGAKETKEVVDNLEKIQSSLSTRYLGLFPEYIGNINILLDDAVNHNNRTDLRDSIIIFEDVLYYGIRSDAKGFRNMMKNLLTLTDKGCHVTIAFYDVDGYPFKQMIRDKMLSYEYQDQYKNDIRSYRMRMNKLRADKDSTQNRTPERATALINKYFDNYLIQNPCNEVQLKELIEKIENRQYVDSTIIQKYYKLSCESNPKKIARTVKGMLQPLPQEESNDAISLRVNKLCNELDSIKTHYMNKPYKEITYSDFYNMYKYITVAIYQTLEKQPNIELIPLNESIMMCCWMSTMDGESNTIFAFPSKYSTDEIGFTSRDAAIVQYIHTMLDGIKGNIINQTDTNTY